MARVSELKKEIRKRSNAKTAKILQAFFKTGPGEYAEGDIFLGLKVLPSRELARQYHDLSLSEIATLLKSKIHEERSIALMIMTHQFAKSKDDKVQTAIYKFYIKYLRHVNNWDLVDGSAPYISGPYLFERDRRILFKLAKSKVLWERRVAMLSAFHFIRQKDFKDALKLAEILVHDEHDLMHKAVGWMLREIGKRDLVSEKKFLKKHAHHMPRTMLRYAIEKFPERERQRYLKA